MKCEICGKGPISGTSVYRINPKGETGRWCCEVHLPADKQPVDDVRAAVAMIESMQQEMKS
jgi:hypothetical protein